MFLTKSLQQFCAVLRALAIKALVLLDFFIKNKCSFYTTSEKMEEVSNSTVIIIFYYFFSFSASLTRTRSVRYSVYIFLLFHGESHYLFSASTVFTFFNKVKKSFLPSFKRRILLN